MSNRITVRQKLMSLVNYRLRAIAAGMSGVELRAIARGEPPTERPNPRYLAHIASFLLHIRPRTYPQATIRFTHTFRLGFLSVLMLIIEIVTGLILMLYYVPTPTAAYQSILRITGQVPFGEIIRDIHRLAGEGMVVLAGLHMIRVFLTASYKGPRRFTWVTGVGLLIIALGLAFSGYLLVWDQLAYWAVTIGTSMAEAVPLFGPQFNLILRGGPIIGGDGLLRFYFLHVVFLPLTAIILSGLHYYRVARLHGISLPATIEAGLVDDETNRRARQKVAFIPTILSGEILWTAGTIWVLLVVALFFYDAPLGHQADPGHTPLDTQAPWFFLWLQGLLKLGDKMLMGVLVPTFILSILFVLPFLDRNPSRLLKKRPLAVALLAVAVAIFIGLSFMGTPAYGIHTPPAARIIQNLAPEATDGPLQSVPFDDLTLGIYSETQTGPVALPPTLAAVLADFRQQVSQARQSHSLPQAEGTLIIEAWQPNLKRITIRIIWLDEETDAPKNYEKVIYLHRNRSRPPRNYQFQPDEAL